MRHPRIARARRSSPLVVRLLALVVVPLVAVTILAMQRVSAEQSAATEASDLVDVVELQQAVAAVLPPSQLEWIALSGLAEIDQLGVPRNLVVGLTGFDLESIYGDNLLDLERAFDTLARDHRTVVLSDGSQLGDELGFIRGALQTQRDLSEQRRATAEDVDVVFERLDHLLQELRPQSQSSVERSTSLDRPRRQLAALGNVLFSAGELSRTLITGVIDGEPDPVVTARAIAVHDTYVALFAATLDPIERYEFHRMLTGANRPTDDAADIPGLDAGALATDPTLIRGAATMIVDQLDYVQALQQYSDDFHGRTAAEVRDTASRARSDAERIKFLMWIIAAITLVLTVVVLWSILVPLRRLARRAIAISRGELDLPPLPEVGPSGLRALTATMNDMLSTFDRVNSRIQGLAAGDLDAPVSDDELPGAIGESLRNSVRHLATVTQLLQRSEALSSAIITQADDAIWTLDDHGTIRSANTASSRLTGLLPEDQVGRPIAHVVSQTTGEATILTRPGQAPKVLVARSVIDVGDERITAVIAHDISERARYEERLTYQALHDALTGLPNRFAVLEHLEQLAIEHPGEVAALYIDLDGFKSVNDVQGHAVGDRVLAEVAQRLTRAVGNGEFIGRLGGDEFVVVTHRFAQQADVVALGHRLVREVETPHEHDGQFLALSACVGITIPSPGTAALDILGQADSAVYQAKRQGRGRVELFDEEMQQRLQQETELELELRNAVRNGELVVYLQPVIDLRTNQFCGAEALVRWIRPGHGMVPPGDFIPLAERSSLIMEIERWVLARACERLVEWRRFERGCTRRIAVNISGRHLIDGDLLADVDAVLNITGADPNMLELELTETQLLEDMDRATRVLDELRRRGIRIAVDDFGTGYSSMTYLRELPIDAIKIDRSFVSRATEHGYDSTVIQALLTIGTTLDLTVVAEGVETAEQLRYLQARGCDMAQGYLLARPMPIEDAEALIFAPVPAVVRPRNPFESVPTQRSDVSESLPA